LTLGRNKVSARRWYKPDLITPNLADATWYLYI